MTAQEQTADPLTIDRTSREPWSPTVKLSTVMASILMFVSLGTLVWTMAVLVTNKADKVTVHQILTDVEVIKTRQLLLIDALRPGLLKKD